MGDDTEDKFLQRVIQVFGGVGRLQSIPALFNHQQSQNKRGTLVSVDETVTSRDTFK